MNGPDRTQTGGITILVALMMLVLLTLAAVGMSRNSFREVVTSGFSRQGAMARNVADSGLEWCLFWLDQRNAPGAAGSALDLVNQKTTLSQDPSSAGQAKNIISGAAYPAGGAGLALDAGMELPAPAGVTQGFTMGLTFMGNPSVTGMSQTVGPGGYAPATGSAAAVAMTPTRWAVRADAQIQQGGVTFVHGKEAWISVPANQQ